MKNKKTMKTAAILLFSSTLAFTSLPTLSLAETDVATTQSDVKSSGDYAALLDAYTSAREKYLPIREAYEQALGDYLASGEEDADTVAQLKADYEKVVAEYEGVKEKYDQAKAAYDEATAVFQTASDAYEAAVTAKDTLNQSIEAVNTIIQAFPADPATATMTIAEWKSAFDEAKAALEGNYATHWTAIEAYQTASDAYYNSSIAPDAQAPIVVENPGDYKAELETFLDSIEELANEDVTQSAAYESLELAVKQFSSDYSNYIKNTSAGNHGDPSDNFNSYWVPVINFLFNVNGGDYSGLDHLGYTVDELKQMTTINEWNQFVSDYENKGYEVLQSLENYTDYLLGCVQEWKQAVSVINEEISLFNGVTGNSLPSVVETDVIEGWVKGIAGTKNNFENNLNVLKSNPLVDTSAYPSLPQSNVYDQLTLNAQMNAYGYSGFYTIEPVQQVNIPTNSPRITSVSIEVLKINKLDLPIIQDVEKLPDIPTEVPNDPQDPSEEPNDPQDPGEEPDDPQDPNEEPNNPQQPSDDQSKNKEKPKEVKTKKTTTFTQTLPKTGSENNILLSAAGFGAILLSGILVLLKKKR